MNDTTHVIAFQDIGQAVEKANVMIASGHNVVIIQSADIVALVSKLTSGQAEAKGMCYSGGDFDWTVVVASKGKISPPSELNP